MKNRVNIILFGKASIGKTTSLMKLAVLLSGGGVFVQVIQNSIDKLFKKGKKYKDARFIIEYKGLLVFIATGGDSWKISRVNYEFFERKNSGLVDVYRINTGNVEALTLDDKIELAKRLPDVCIKGNRGTTQARKRNEANGRKPPGLYGGITKKECFKA